MALTLEEYNAISQRIGKQYALENRMKKEPPEKRQQRIHKWALTHLSWYRRYSFE